VRDDFGSLAPLRDDPATEQRRAMMQVRHTVTIERPVTDVFAYLTNLGRMPEWQSGLAEMRQESDGDMRIGTRLKEVRRFLGRQVESTLEVTEWDPGRRWALRVVDGPVRYRVDHLLEPADGRTRLHWLGEGEPGRFFRMAESLVARQAKRQFAGDFATLKNILESERGA
jgi:uncharacterized membrane protein